MAVRKFLQTLVKGKPYNLRQLLDEVAAVRSRHSFLALSGSPTGPNWLGIRNATLQLFPDASIELPQQYSQPLLDDKDLELFARAIRDHQFSNVVFSGFPPYFKKLVNKLHNIPGLQVGVILHGTFSEVGHGGKVSDAMILPLQLLQEKKIQKIAAVRKDVASFVGKRWNCSAYALHNKCLLPANVQPAIAKDGVKRIGVFGTENFNKNLHNQVGAAVTVNGVQVYVTQPELYTYLNSNAIVGVSRSNHYRFLENLVSMDINLHLSFSESWGQIAAESMALGVPCLVGPNTNLLDSHEELKRALTVEKIDSPLSIAVKIDEVLAQAHLPAACINYMQTINAEADLLIQKFLEGK